eukprot:7663123-Heterocapsa_arctica.AAC.1
MVSATVRLALIINHPRWKEIFKPAATNVRDGHLCAHVGAKPCDAVQHPAASCKGVRLGEDLTEQD